MKRGKQMTDANFDSNEQLYCENCEHKITSKPFITNIGCFCSSECSLECFDEELQNADNV